MSGTIFKSKSGAFTSSAFQIPPGEGLSVLIGGTSFSATVEATLDASGTDWVSIGTLSSPLTSFPPGISKFRVVLASGTSVTAQYSTTPLDTINAQGAAGPDYSGAISTAQGVASAAYQLSVSTQASISYASKATLSADSNLPSASRAVTDGSFWDWSATGAADGGRVITAPGGYRIRADKGGARPEWYGAVGDGVVDDTAALSACINNNALTLLKAGATYRVRTPLFAYNLCRIVAEGVILRQLSGYPDDISVSGPRAARIYWNPNSTPTYETACLTLQRSGSEIVNVEFYTDQPTDTPGWAPVETGWAVNVYAPWCELSGMARGFRYGIRGGKTSGAIECAGIRIPVWYDGTYDIGIKIEQCTDTPRIGHVHGSIWAEPNNFSDANRIKYRLLNHQGVWLKRADGAVIGEIFNFLGNTALLLEGVSAKTTVGVIDGDDSMYAIRVSGGGDLNVHTLIYQRVPEGGYATGSNPAGLSTGLDTGNAITTFSGASGMITIANIDARNTRGGMVYLDGSARVKIGQGQVVNWGVKSGNTVPCYSVAGAGSTLTLGEGVETGASTSGAQVFAVNAPALLHATAYGTQTPGAFAVPANSHQDFGISVAGSQPVMTIDIGTSDHLPDGITAAGICTAAGTVVVRVRNSTIASINVPALTWRVTCKS